MLKPSGTFTYSTFIGKVTSFITGTVTSAVSKLSVRSDLSISASFSSYSFIRPVSTVDRLTVVFSLVTATTFAMEFILYSGPEILTVPGFTVGISAIQSAATTTEEISAVTVKSLFINLSSLTVTVSRLRELISKFLKPDTFSAVRVNVYVPEPSIFVIFG